MTTVTLHPGEALRIEAAGQRLLVLQSGAGYEIRRERPGFLARLVARWRAHRDRVELEALDPQALRDIGLEHLAIRVAERRRLEAHWSRFPGFY